jgi:hypothetical protein
LVYGSVNHPSIRQDGIAHRVEPSFCVESFHT